MFFVLTGETGCLDTDKTSLANKWRVCNSLFGAQSSSGNLRLILNRANVAMAFWTSIPTRLNHGHVQHFLSSSFSVEPRNGPVSSPVPMPQPVP
jgi:hypothetical protein